MAEGRLKILAAARNTVIHILILLFIFIIAILFFINILNQTTLYTASAMQEATFPLVYMQNKGISYNCLHGYASEIDVNYIRDTVTVLDSSHELDIVIQPFGSDIENVSYEVLTTDGRESLENTSVINLRENGDYIEATLNISNQMLMDQEYILKIQISAGGGKVYFYTRLIQKDGLHLDDYLDFVTGFYEKCVNKTDQDSLGVVVEPDETTGTSKTLAKMDIHDTVAQLMWGSLNPQMNYKPVPSLVDINNTTASFVLNYRIMTSDTDGVSTIYNVKEFYRLRYTDSRVFLLDFTRTTDEIFNPDNNIFDSESIILGISGSDIEYAFSGSGNVTAFVKENELWTYRINSGVITLVFGFPEEENYDYRDFYGQNNIKILKTDDSGDIWYVVSGYMNRGNHEGENGIAFYHYSDASSSSEELLFIRTMEAYDSLKLDIDTLSYITEDEQNCYILLEDIVYRINLTNGECERVITDVHNDCFTSSDSNRYFSWLSEGERYGSATLSTVDFETGNTNEITCNPDEYIRQICYMGDDLVYGIARVLDVDNSGESDISFPMYCIYIVNAEGEVVKEYKTDNVYVTEIEKSENMLTLSRVVRIDGEFVQTTSDTIVNTGTEENVNFGISTKTDKIKQTEIVLRVGTAITDESVQKINGKFDQENSPLFIEIPPNEDREKLYYVYAGGSLDSCWPTAAEAITRADEMVGVVINYAKEYVWERGNTQEKASISIEKIPDIIKTGTMDADLIQETLNKETIDLTGCTLDQVLYFVSKGRTVTAKTDTGSVIITGYDDYGNLILLNPGEDETYFYGPNDSRKLFEEAGNHFVTYLETAVE